MRPLRAVPAGRFCTSHGRTWPPHAVGHSAPRSANSTWSTVAATSARMPPSCRTASPDTARVVGQPPRGDASTARAWATCTRSGTRQPSAPVHAAAASSANSSNGTDASGICNRPAPAPAVSVAARGASVGERSTVAETCTSASSGASGARPGTARANSAGDTGANETETRVPAPVSPNSARSVMAADTGPACTCPDALPSTPPPGWRFRLAAPPSRRSTAPRRWSFSSIMAS